MQNVVTRAEREVSRQISDNMRKASGVPVTSLLCERYEEKTTTTPMTACGLVSAVSVIVRDKLSLSS